MRITGGSRKGREVPVPKDAPFRPTSGRVREGYFSHVASALPGSRFLDLFSGSGLVGFEALSRGAGQVTFVENQAELVRRIETNLSRLEFAGKVLRGDAKKLLRGFAPQEIFFDLVYADPPYAYEDYERLLLWILPVVPRGEIAVEARKPHPLANQSTRLLHYGDTVVACIQTGL